MDKLPISKSQFPKEIQNMKLLIRNSLETRKLETGKWNSEGYTLIRTNDYWHLFGFGYVSFEIFRHWALNGTSKGSGSFRLVKAWLAGKA
jgi:hypothetical protein